MSENTTAIAQLCERYGLSQSELARRFEIPLRTVQDWHAGRRTPPDYVVHMLHRLLDLGK
jgi:DNA-binding transcriptional regulator YiaG